MNHDFVQVSQTKILVFGDHRGIKRLAELASADAGVALDLHLSDGGIRLVELTPTEPL